MLWDALTHQQLRQLVGEAVAVVVQEVVGLRSRQAGSMGREWVGAVACWEVFLVSVEQLRTRMWGQSARSAPCFLAPPTAEGCKWSLIVCANGNIQGEKEGNRRGRIAACSAPAGCSAR